MWGGGGGRAAREDAARQNEAARRAAAEAQARQRHRRREEQEQQQREGEQQHRDFITATIKTGCEAMIGREVFIPCIINTPGDGHDLPFELQRRQLPIKQCFAMTINKSQGQTLKRCAIYLPTQVFSHGQLYVAMSRCGERAGVKILTKPPEDWAPGEPVYISNIVYREIFDDA